MSELISVQPAKPGDGTNTAYSGLSGVWYTDQERDTNMKVFFAVTLRTVVMQGDGSLRHGQMSDAMEHMQQFINWHLDGLVEINESCIWRDPQDQRPAGDTRKHYGSNNSQASAPRTTPDGKEVKSFNCAKVEKERDPKNKKTYIGFYMNNHKFPDVKVTPDQETMWNKACDQLSQITGDDWLNAELGTTSTVPMVCGYTESNNTKANGNPYWDFYGVRAK